MPSQKLLITGATGYIGGTVLTQLLNSTVPGIISLSFSALIRHQSQADILAEKGIQSIIFNGLDDTEIIRQAAADHDVIIHIANSFHKASAEAMLQGLHDRKAKTGKTGIFIHTSGTSNVADFPITKKYRGTRVFDDKEDIFSYEKSLDLQEPYQNRSVDIFVAETGKRLGVDTYSIWPPLVFGIGTGFFRTLSNGQLPMLMRLALANGESRYIGEGAGRWSYVHVEDLAALYETVVASAIAGKISPHDRAIFFAEIGSSSFAEIADNIGRAGLKLGALKTTKVSSISLESIARDQFHGDMNWAEIVFGSESLVAANLSREIGWRPKKTAVDWEATFIDEFRLVFGEANGVNRMK
ncbi:hypotheticall protein [Colletotrichum fructicola]|uniref:Nad dependent epimerase dehydratase family protein n=1 Tax=Colletotrichum fructicola (strain Nara gc5) TaxID=1213859 RepID=L2FRN4_COLFN|nr:uncharacterized protein CGMCC3_g3945 [Colletotrichum fructicola]KAF4479298.1 Uncharacterized protein CGGC5_v012098 [Colletotrichum fructicola Nara gc5]KAE9580179.1 hypothetical protein CGMCC3_g3945 [Colletotrichum fructicola]KAF4433835.1 Uncharacterized protein CFRS1_v010523 [Colletotrichum fructicola]KAF4882698.1 hypotheticall protein [Colletotrichum fructicola]KAF4888563.1 hypotheticall protein [Colletotrichum fructicola]